MITLGSHLVVKLYLRHASNRYRLFGMVLTLIVMKLTTTHLRTASAEPLLDVREVAHALGVTPWWTRRLIASAALRAINVGGPDKSARWRVAPEDLAAFIRARENRSRDLLR